MVTWTRWRWQSEQFVALFNRLIHGNSQDPSVYNNRLQNAMVALSGGRHGGDGARGEHLLGLRELGALMWTTLLSLSVPAQMGMLLLLVVGLFPFCMGLLVNLVVFIPLRISPEKTLVLGFPEVRYIFLYRHYVLNLLTYLGCK